MSNKKLVIEKKNDGNRMVLVIKGTIDQEAELKKVFSELSIPVIFDLEGIEMINSAGVREWVNAIAKLPTKTPFTLERCSPRIVEQLNYVEAFLGHGEVVSFFAPYFCPKCKVETTVLLEVKVMRKKSGKNPPPQNCAKCKNLLEFDDIEEEYFGFIQ